MKSPLKMMKNDFYFILKAHFVLKIFKLLVETMFLRYQNKRRRKEKHLETRLQRKHVNFGRENSCY